MEGEMKGGSRVALPVVSSWLSSGRKIKTKDTWMIVIFTVMV